MSHIDNANELEAAITRTLEQPPVVAVPMDFAARVRQSLPPVAAPQRTRSVGRMVAMVAVVLLAIGMFAVAPHVTASATNLAFYVEMLMLVQLAGIAWWFLVRREV